MAVRRDEPALSEAEVRLPASVRLVAADNTGKLTGPGTNTYLVGTRRVAVIDPGPDDGRHRAALLAAIGAATVTHILLTHRHADHAGGVPALAAATGAPILGGDTLSDGAVIEESEWRLEAIATPGHTPDHLCFSLPGPAALFSGDHVMGWSTTMIAPPEGRMADYLRSLRRLLDRPERLYLPGHGPAIADGPARVRELLAHRQARQEAILARLAAGDRSIAAIVRAVYRPLDPELVAAAELSVLAHLQDLIERGLVRADPSATLDATFATAWHSGHGR